MRFSSTIKHSLNYTQNPLIVRPTAILNVERQNDHKIIETKQTKTLATLPEPELTTHWIPFQPSHIPPLPYENLVPSNLNTSPPPTNPAILSTVPFPTPSPSPLLTARLAGNPAGQIPVQALNPQQLALRHVPPPQSALLAHGSTSAQRALTKQTATAWMSVPQKQPPPPPPHAA